MSDDRTTALADDEDLLATGMVDDPYPVLATWRERRPVHWNDRWHGWVVTRHRDVDAALREPRLSADTITPYLDNVLDAGQAQELEFSFAMMRRWIVFADPPDHSRIRRVLSRTFTPRTVAGLRPAVEELTEGLLDGCRGESSVDLLDAFAYPLPAAVIGRMLGVPDEDLDRLRGWSDDIAVLIHGGIGTAGRRERAQESMRGFRDYLADLAEQKRTIPGTDLLSRLLTADDPSVTDEELLASAVLLLVAGHETTQNLIANGVLCLLRHPRARAALGTADGARGVVEEVLRFEGPSRSTIRQATGDVEVGGTTMRRGDRVLLMLNAANRDPEQFPEPDTFDPFRRTSGHLGFGQGIHFCLGAHLARLEGAVALPSLFARFPDLRLADPDALQWNPRIITRGLTALPVTL